MHGCILNVCAHSNCITHPQGQGIIFWFPWSVQQYLDQHLITIVDLLTDRLADLAIALRFYAHRMC